MNDQGITQIELSIFLFFSCLSLIIFTKAFNHIQKQEKRELNEFVKQWNQYQTRNIQRIYKEEK